MSDDLEAGLRALQALREAAGTARQRRLAVLSGDAAWSRDIARRLLGRNPDARRLCVTATDRLPTPRLPYAKAMTHLGRELELLVYDGWSGLDPDALGALSGTVTAGGLVLLLTPPLEHWPLLPDPAIGPIAIAGRQPDEESRFLQRLVKAIRHDPACWLWHQGDMPPQPAAATAPAKSLVVGDPDCLTEDQARAVSLVSALGRGPGQRAAVLTADRGRGKSAALGIAAGRLLRDGGYHIVVTAPRSGAAARIFEHARQACPGIREHGRTLRVDGSTMEYTAPDALLHSPPAAHLLLVDEAAGLPAPVLEGLVRAFPRVAFATTVHGYEGTGRGFAIRFAGTLARLRPGHEHLHLEIPVRWAPHDPVERFIARALLLDAEPASAADLTGKDASENRYQVLDRDTLVADEPLLRQIFGLLVNAHYRTTPTDLRNLLDGPTTGVHVLTAGHAVVGAALSLDEGPFDPALAAAIWLGWRRPNGHLMPQSLAFHGGCRAAARLRCRRIMRIAVHPALRRHGLGLRLLDEIGKGAAADGVPWLGTSFGATTDLMDFWNRAGFRPVRMGHRREAASGAHAVMMASGLSPTGAAVAEAAARQLQADLPSQLGGSLADLEPALQDRLAAPQLPTQTDPAMDWLRVYGVAHGRRPLDADRPALQRCLSGTLPPADDGGSLGFFRRWLDGRATLHDAAGGLGVASRKAGEHRLRQIIGELLARVDCDAARTAARSFNRIATLAERARIAGVDRLDALGRISPGPDA